VKPSICLHNPFQQAQTSVLPGSLVSQGCRNRSWDRATSFGNETLKRGPLRASQLLLRSVFNRAFYDTTAPLSSRTEHDAPRIFYIQKLSTPCSGACRHRCALGERTRGTTGTPPPLLSVLQRLAAYHGASSANHCESSAVPIPSAWACHPATRSTLDTWHHVKTASPVMITAGQHCRSETGVRHTLRRSTKKTPRSPGLSSKQTPGLRYRRRDSKCALTRGRASLSTNNPRTKRSEPRNPLGRRRPCSCARSSTETPAKGKQSGLLISGGKAPSSAQPVLRFSFT